MKRYEISAAILAGTADIPELYVDEEPDGEWVRADEALAEIAKLLAENAVFAAALDSNPFSAGADAIRGCIAEALREMEKPALPNQ